MPLVIAGYALVLERPLEFALPVSRLLTQLLVMAVIPVLLGAFARDRWPELERRHGRTLRALSAVGVGAIVLVGLAQGAGTMGLELLYGGALSAVFASVSMVTGWAVGTVYRAPVRDRFTLLVEFAVRNLALALVIEVTLLHHPGFVAFGALALLAQATLLMAAVHVYRRSCA
jgi:BASS family bile acid:Na+ symporter